VKVPSELEEELQERRGRKRLPVTGDFVESHQIREEKAKEKKEKELDRRIEDILRPSVPNSKAWKAFLEREAELEEELSQTPTSDLASQLIEKITQTYKAADCSVNMKGALGGRVKMAAAICRAAANISLGYPGQDRRMHGELVGLPDGR